jgi:hypothetical protein
MRHNRVPAVVLLFAMAAAGGGLASAQTPAAAPSAEALKKAEDLFHEGLHLTAYKRWPEAESKFLAAWALNPTYDVASNLGYVEQQLGKYPEAAERLAFALKTWPLAGSRVPHDLAAKRFEELRALVATLTIKVNVPGAKVLVDGKEIGTSPLDGEAFAAPGARTVEAKLAGYDDAKQVVEAPKGGALVVALALAAPAPPPPIPAVTPAATAAPTVTPPPRKPPPVEENGPNKAVLATGAVATGLGLGAGLVLVIVANAKGSDAASKAEVVNAAGNPRACAGMSSNCTTLVGALKDQDAFSNAAVWTFVGAGAVGAATLVYALVGGKGDAESGVRAMPVVTGHGGALVMSGSF